MVGLAAGLLLVVLVAGGVSAFSRASVGAIKTVLAVVAAFVGLGVAALLLVTGRGALAVSGLVLLAPLAWRMWQGGLSGPARGGPMDRAEALAVLGLTDGATEAEVREAWLHLMRAVHPDGGGSDWLASRVNQAKDVLLRR